MNKLYSLNDCQIDVSQGELYNDKNNNNIYYNAYGKCGSNRVILSASIAGVNKSDDYIQLIINGLSDESTNDIQNILLNKEGCIVYMIKLENDETKYFAFKDFDMQYDNLNAAYLWIAKHITIE